jgi:hypothetical protein
MPAVNDSDNDNDNTNNYSCSIILYTALTFFTQIDIFNSFWLVITIYGLQRSISTIQLNCEGVSVYPYTYRQIICYLPISKIQLYTFECTHLAAGCPTYINVDYLCREAFRIDLDNLHFIREQVRECMVCGGENAPNIGPT